MSKNNDKRVAFSLLYPEHAKFKARETEMRAHAEFLDWLCDIGVARAPGDDGLSLRESDCERLVFDYFEINLVEFRREKDRMVERMLKEVDDEKR
jgi:hypothetical protein